MSGARTEVAPGVRLALPDGWVVVRAGPPLVARPPAAAWAGERPSVVVSHEPDDLAGDELAAALARVTVERLADPVVVDLAVAAGGAVELVVAHHHRGVDVTTVEHHHPSPGGRWVVGFTCADVDAPAAFPLARRVVAGLEVGGR